MANTHRRSLELWDSLTLGSIALCFLLLLCYYHSPRTYARTGMATSAFTHSSCALLLILLVAVTQVHVASGQRVPLAATITMCYPATNATNSTAFGANVAALLATLPSAAARTGFATLRSTGRSDRAFVRGLCFDDAAPQECVQCLSMAATNISSTCGASSHRRAGTWTDGCFLSYADANDTTPDEDAFRGRAISSTDPLANASGPDLERLASVAQFLAPRAALSDNMLATVDTTAVASYYAERSTVRVLAQCARDRTAAQCDRCLEYSARVAGSCCWGLDPWRDGVAAAVVAFNCYLRFEVSTVPVPLRKRIAMFIDDNFKTTALLAAVVLLLLVLGLAKLIKKIYNYWMGRKIRAVNNNAIRNTATAAAAPWAARVELVQVDRAQA